MWTLSVACLWPCTKGSPGFVVDPLKGIYCTKDVKTQRESRLPNTPGCFLTRRILGEGEIESEALATSLGVAPQQPPHTGYPWLQPFLRVNPGETPSCPLFGGQATGSIPQATTVPSLRHLRRPPKSWTDGSSLVPLPYSSHVLSCVLIGPSISVEGLQLLK